MHVKKPINCYKYKDFFLTYILALYYTPVQNKLRFHYVAL